MIAYTSLETKLTSNKLAPETFSSSQYLILHYKQKEQAINLHEKYFDSSGRLYFTINKSKKQKICATKIFILMTAYTSLETKVTSNKLTPKTFSFL